jgi:hypothetical protein
VRGTSRGLCELAFSPVRRVRTAALIIISLGAEVSLRTLGGLGRDLARRIAGAEINIPLAFSAAGKYSLRQHL